MSKLSIKVTVAGRNYPLTIDMEEEQVIREAANKVNECVSNLQQNYAISDKNDLLAMTALQMATENLNNRDSKEKGNMEAELQKIDSILDHALENNEGPY